MKLLIIEDDEEELRSLRAGLTREGFDVQTVSDGAEGLRAAKALGHDLILLDVMLPGRDGFSLADALRQSGDDTPIVFLTARVSVEDRIRGLTLGADDYVVKPFSLGELAARIRTVLRRATVHSAAHAWKSRNRDLLRIGDLELDLIRNRAARAGRQLKLTPKEFALLSLLARRHGEVLSRPTIAEQVWDEALEGGTNVVDVHVRRLRAKIDDPYDHKLVHTIRGVGYVLEERSEVRGQTSVG